MARTAWNKGLFTSSKEVNCKNCNNLFRSFKRSRRKQYGLYCSNRCRADWKIKLKSIILNCPTCRKDFRTTPGHLKKGKKYCSRFCMISNEDWKAMRKNWASGSKNHFWKGGVTVILRGIRRSAEYQRARKMVLKRDGFACILCYANSPLDVDHIKPVSLFPELSCDAKNMRTLCRPCHKKTPSYGVNKQFIEVNANIWSCFKLTENKTNYENE